MQGCPIGGITLCGRLAVGAPAEGGVAGILQAVAGQIAETLVHMQGAVSDGDVGAQFVHGQACFQHVTQAGIHI